MKKKYLIPGISALAVVAAVGATSAVMAAGNSNFGGTMFGRFGGHQFQNLTDDQRSDFKAKNDAVKAALESGDYNAWVAAVKAENSNAPILQKVTADNFKSFADGFKERETRADAVKAAIDASDYNAWVAAVKAENSNAPILQKINANNFSQYVQAVKLREQAGGIMQNLGIERGNKAGFGPGMMGGFGGFGMMEGRHGGLGRGMFGSGSGIGSSDLR